MKNSKLSVLVFSVGVLSAVTVQAETKSGGFWGGLDTFLDKVDETSAQVTQASERVNTSAKKVKQTNQVLNDTKENVKDAASGEGVDDSEGAQ